MKKSITLMVAALVTLTTMANTTDKINEADRDRDGRLSIFNAGNQDIRIEIDGRRYNDNGRTFVLRNLSPGSHRIKIYTENRGGGVFGDIFGTRVQRVIYNNSIHVKPRTHVMMEINRYNRVEIDERRLGNNGKWDDDDRWDDRNRDRGRDNDYDRDRDHNRDDDYNTGGGWDNGYGRPMDERSFLTFVQTLSRERFEDTRFTLARNSFDRQMFSSDQVKRVLQYFSMENNKLELAKFAYRNTVDKNNYHVIYDVFSFSRSKEDLSNYIRSYR
jgi:hypothetical protein